MTPKYITVHNTANDASAGNEISYMINNDQQVSFHFAVDDKEAVQGLPLNRNGWHAGDGANGTGNRQSIGVEICYSKSGGTRFTNAEQNAAWLVAKLMKDHNIPISNLRTHKDWNGKNCPERTLNMGWSRFLSMVQKELNGGGNATQYFPIPNYTGNSLVDALNSINVDSSFNNRARIAEVNGISNYTGTAAQNTQMLNLLKQGKLIKP